ncbi:MAG: AAA family ATPase [bacterium]
MLDFIEIKNFRSCEDVRLRLAEPVVALLGRNGVGKTSLLHAIALTAHLCAKDDEPEFGISPRNGWDTIQFTLGLSVAGDGFFYTTQRPPNGGHPILFTEQLSRGPNVLFERHGEMLNYTSGGRMQPLRLGMGASALPTLLRFLPTDDPLRGTLQSVADVLGAVVYYPLQQPFREHVGDGQLIERSKYEAWKSGSGRTVPSPPPSVQMRLLDLYLARRADFDELRALLGPDGIGLLADIRVGTVEIPVSGGPSAGTSTETAYALSFVPGDGLAGAGRSFRYSGLSAGTWRILQLFTYLIFDRNSCMLVEQPEDSIHPGLLEKVVDVLRSYAGRTQLICTTHSPAVMNLIGAKGIRLVTATEGTTRVDELSDRDVESAQDYLKDHGTLAEFLKLMEGRVV